jgi:HK97 family phage prohead protease
MILGATHSGTLRLSQDQRGLFYEIDLPETRADVGELVERGDMTGSSFAFQTYEDDWKANDGGTPMRYLRFWPSSRCIPSDDTGLHADISITPVVGRV